MPKKNAKEERKSGRRAAWDRDRKDREGGGTFLQKRGFLVGPEILEDLNVSEYRTEGGDDGDWITNKIHILPSHPDDCEENMDLIAFKIYAHYDIGANGESFLCPKWMKEWFDRSNILVPEIVADGKCPICEEHARLLAHYKKVKGKLAEDEWTELWQEMVALRPHSDSYKSPKPKRYFLWVLDATDEDTENEGVKYYFMPVKVYEQGVLDRCEGEDEGGFVDIADPKGGRIFQFKRTGKGKQDTDYTGYKLKKVDYTVEDFCKDVPRYFDVLQFHTYDEMAEALHGSTSEKTDKEDDGGPEERPRRRRHKTEVEEAFENVPDPDDKEEDKSRRRRRRPTEEERDDDDDDGSEDVKKIRKRRRDRQKNQEDEDEDA